MINGKMSTSVMFVQLAFKIRCEIMISKQSHARMSRYIYMKLLKKTN